MTNVYIDSGRLISPEETDKKLEKIIAKINIDKFKEKHPIISFTCYPIIKAYYTLRK